MIENLSGNQMLLGLIIGLAVLIFLVLKTKIHAFVALIIATVVIGVIGGMPLVKETFPDGKSLGIIMSITKGFGGTLSGIGIIIGFGVILGKIFEISGAAQRMAITFLNLFGKKREEEAMAITGFFVSIPIFCDSGFIVVSPIAKAIARTVKKSVIGIGAALAGASSSRTPWFRRRPVLSASPASSMLTWDSSSSSASAWPFPWPSPSSCTRRATSVTRCPSSTMRTEA